MAKNLIVLFIISFTINYCYSQKIDYLNQSLYLSVSKPSVLSTHPLGIFISRIQGNFKFKPYEKSTLSINLESGNVWGTPITTYIPNNNSIRDQVRLHHWHQAQYFFNYEDLDAKTFDMQIDGVIKGLRAKASFNINNNHEINIGLRMFALTKGKLPFTLLTSDDFIEKFHKNIAGGNDPFDRSVFGLNKANIFYTDINGNTLNLKQNDIVFGGIEGTYYYYPKTLSTTTFSINFGTHFGINFSDFNKSVDFGISMNNLKLLQLKGSDFLQLGLNIGVLRKNTININTNNIILGSNNLLGNLETILAYNIISKNNTKHSFGIDYYFQTSLNKRDEINYAILIRHPNAHNSWGHGVTNLYKNNNYWSLFYSFTKKIITSFYLQQDFEVNNNPDIQTGIHITFPIN